MLLGRGLRVLACWVWAFASWAEAAETTSAPIDSFRTLTIPSGPVGTAPALPPGRPQPPPAYAKGHANNAVGVAPDKHNMTGPYRGDEPTRADSNARIAAAAAAGDGYWLSEFGPLGKSPLAPAGYQFFRNVKDFGAVGDGVTDDTAAINRAVSSFSIDNQDDVRCDGDCGSTTTLTAVVYFPAGTYLISSPILQYYYTQFVGNPWERPTIKGSAEFEGIALFDANFYEPGGNGSQWYVNQSNFFRQIRNFIFDLTAMPRKNYQNDQEYVPAGIHWQVGQATSISRCHFEMPLSDASGATTAIGIFMENGSGGSVDDLTFRGGNIGFLAGSQQFTATNLRFELCLTAIKHEWNWGFVWKNIYVQAAYIAIDCTAFSESTNPPQGTGSISVIDSHFNGVPYAITLGNKDNQRPSIVLDNLLVENSESVVLVSGGETLLAGGGGPRYFNSWISGFQTSPSGVSGRRAGFAPLSPNKPSSLLDGRGRYYYKSKPQYEGTTPLVATNFGVRNDGTGDQTKAINSLLSSHVGSIIFFPAGIYMVKGTVEIPLGSIITGSGWSTIMGTGSYFGDEFNPKVMVRVGREGDKGKIEISDMLFTVKGATKGAILMEWNVHESSQGSAAMWDSHFRVGGNAGSDLLLDDCPAHTGSVNRECMSATMLMHMTKKSSGFFDNVWVWVADHDLDDPANAGATVGPGGIPDNSAVEIAVYVARGVLIESQGPSWFWGCASEHAQLYQWQLLDAKNIVMGHVQTETPYYQSDPDATEPYTIGEWPSDPTFLDCDDSLCKKAWAMRILNSTDVFMYAMGFYSFFDNYKLGCAPEEDCQKSLIDTNYAGDTWLYNIFTKGNHEIISPGGDLRPIWFNDTTRNGYTSSVAAWLALANERGVNIGEGDDPSGEDGSHKVYIDPEIWESGGGGGGGGDKLATIQCYAPCTYVFPPISLDRPTTISFHPVTTSLEVGWFTTTTYEQGWSTITTTEYVSVTHSTTITPPPVTLTEIPIRDITLTKNVTSTDLKLTSSIDVPTFIITNSRKSGDPTGVSIPPRTRTITLPPWPWPSNEDEDHKDDELEPFTTIRHTRGPPKPTCKSGCGTGCKVFCDAPCLLFCDWNIDFPHPPDFYDPIDPGGPPPGIKPRPTPGPPGNGENPDKECETTTYESCREVCTVSPSSSCASTCSDVVGCDTRTGIPSTVTLASAYANTYPEHSPNRRDPAITEVAASGSSAISYLASLGEWSFGQIGGGSSGRPTRTSTSKSQPQPTDDPPSCEECCDECSDDLGAQDECAWWDYACVVNYCKSNTNCQDCGLDCDALDTSTDPEGPICSECGDNIGASECPAADKQCLLDQCHNDWFCQKCNFDCEALFD